MGALRQPIAEFDPADWITVDEAAARTGLSLRHWQRIAARQAARQAARTAASGSFSSSTGLARLGLPVSGRGKPVWWVHRSIDPRLARVIDDEVRLQRDADQLREGDSAVSLDRAHRRARWMHEWRNRIACAHSLSRVDGRSSDIANLRSPIPHLRRTDAQVAEQVVREARAAEGHNFKISPRSLRAWWSAYNRMGDDGQIMGLRGLIDRYRGPHPAGETAARSPEAMEFFFSLYRTGAGLKITTCHDMTVHESRSRGWSWPESISATRVWLRRCDDLSESCLYREGGTAWARKFLRHVETDWDSVDPGQMYVSDHHQLDLWCWYQGRQIRPWLTAVQDMRSRAIVGWHLGPAPHQDAIITALQMAFRHRAVPDVIRIDNGRDYTGKLLTGMTRAQRDALRQQCGKDWRQVVRREGGKVGVDTRWMGILTELQVRVVFAQPYHAWSKGTIERWFGTLENQFGRTFGTYCGSSTIRRPEYVEWLRRGYTSDQRHALRRKHGREWRRVAALRLVDSSHVPSLEQLREQLSDYITCYHAAEHQGDGMLRRSPDEVWATATRLRRAVDAELAVLCQGRGFYKVHGRGVALRVGSGVLSYGRTAPALARLRGREVFIALDPSDISYCLAYTADKSRRFLGRLEANSRIPAMTGVDDFREVLAENAREQAVIGKSRRVSMRRVMDSAARLRERRAMRAAELRATGTDNLRPVVDVVPVITDFAASAAVSKPLRTALDRPSKEAFPVEEAPVAPPPIRWMNLLNEAAERRAAQ